MLTKTFFAAGALISLAAAVPMQQNKRDIVYTTEVQEEYVTVDVTTTIWLSPGETPPAQPAGAPPQGPGHYGHGHGHHGHPHKPKTTSATVSVPPVAPSSPPAAPSSPPEESTTYSIPSTPTSAPAPPPYSAPAAPTSTQASAPVPSSNPSSGGGSSSSGGTHVGDITYYTPGMGSCGWTNSSTEAVVALPEQFMSAHNGANPNTNPYCGSMISISNGGKTASAMVVDTCPGCEGWSIDLSPSVFGELAAMSLGRVSGVKWSFT